MQYINTSVNSMINYQASGRNHLESLTTLELDEENKLISQKPKILVVEDEIINQTIACISLKEQGYDCDIAQNGEEALALLANNNYTAILMDVGLPDMDGLEVTRRIRALEQGSDRRIPIIACTANGLEYKQKCLNAGMDAFSAKPFKFCALSSALSRTGK